MDKHELGNMIYCLENKKDLKEVKFTKSAVAEVLGYLKELQNKDVEVEKLIKEKDEKIEKLERLVKAWSDECERRFSWKKSVYELVKELNIIADELELVKLKTGEFEDIIEDPIKINIYRSISGQLCSLINNKLT